MIKNLPTEKEIISKWEVGDIDNPIVSISCLTYNHDKYIRDALAGFLIQDTIYAYQIYVLDDASTDNNVNIIKEYQSKYPNLFQCFFLKENTWQKPNRLQIAKPYLDARNRGKYIAMCEGDDYWTDPLKLQKQVDFLESNPEYSMCVHNAIVHFEDVENRDYFFNPANQKSIITTEDLIEKWSFATASILFLARFQPDIDNEMSSRIHNADLFLALMVSLHGPIKYIPDVMSVYRRSIYAIKNKSFRKPGKNFNRHYILDKMIELLKIFDNLSNGKYNKQVESKIEQLKNTKKRDERYYHMPILKYFKPNKIHQFLKRSLFKSEYVKT